MPITMENQYNPVQFMIVDDDEVSVMAIKRSMKQLKLVNPISIASDGVDALQQLRDSVDSENRLPPFILTLDLSMPRMGGLEFLEEVRKDALFKKLIVFVLTTSDSPTDIASAYEKNIAGYIVKENPTETFRQALELLHDYAQLVVLPS
jgi:CheY-like chemotaxis protein